MLLKFFFLKTILQSYSVDEKRTSSLLEFRPVQRCHLDSRKKNFVVERERESIRGVWGVITVNRVAERTRVLIFPFCRYKLISNLLHLLQFNSLTITNNLSHYVSLISK